MDSLFDTLIDGILEKGEALADEISRLPLKQKIEALNKVRAMLHTVSPFSDPVDNVQWVPVNDVHSNDYNPNAVAPPEMKLLKLSIDADGYTQPVVCWQNALIEVVDGEHRARIGQEVKSIRKRLHGYLPVTFINPERQGRNNRIAATIRHNRARGVHNVMSMSDIVAELILQGWSDLDIAKELGMDADEVLRFKQNTGMAELFAKHEYSRAWD